MHRISRVTGRWMTGLGLAKVQTTFPMHHPGRHRTGLACPGLTHSGTNDRKRSGTFIRPAKHAPHFNMRISAEWRRPWIEKDINGRMMLNGRPGSVWACWTAPGPDLTEGHHAVSISSHFDASHNWDSLECTDKLFRNPRCRRIRCHSSNPRCTAQRTLIVDSRPAPQLPYPASDM